MSCGVGEHTSEWVTLNMRVVWDSGTTVRAKSNHGTVWELSNEMNGMSSWHDGTHLGANMAKETLLDSFIAYHNIK